MHDVHRLSTLVQRLVHVGQRPCHLGHDMRPNVQIEELRNLDGTTSELRQGLAADVLHGDEVRSLFAGGVIYVDDVGMVQHGGDARLAQKHVHHGLMFRPTWLQDLEYQFLAECARGLVRGKEDLRHSARRQMLVQGIATELGTFEVLRACHADCRHLPVQAIISTGKIHHPPLVNNLASSHRATEMG